MCYICIGPGLQEHMQLWYVYKSYSVDLLPVLYRKLDRGEVTELERVVTEERKGQEQDTPLLCCKEKGAWLLARFCALFRIPPNQDENVRS